VILLSFSFMESSGYFLVGMTICNCFLSYRLTQRTLPKDLPVTPPMFSESAKGSIWLALFISSHCVQLDLPTSPLEFLSKSIHLLLDRENSLMPQSQRSTNATHFLQVEKWRM